MERNKTIVIIQHVAFEGPALLLKLLERLDYEITFARLYENQPLPKASEVGGIVTLGGPMSVHDHARFNWIKPEQNLIRVVALQDKPVFGLCLGAQQIATAFGAEVVPSPQPEIGYWPIAIKPDFAAELDVAEQLAAFHWHGEMVHWPDSSVNNLPLNLRLRDQLATTPGCPNQLFMLGKRVIGLQFHPEVDDDAVRTLYDAASDEYNRSKAKPFVAPQQLDPNPDDNSALLRALVSLIFARRLASDG